MKNRVLTLLVLLTIFLIPFVTYLYGAAPTVLYGDSAEFQAVANLGGVAHPSGYPTYILFGQLFRQIIPGDFAHRINVMSAFFGAASLLVLALIFLRLGFARWLTLTGCLVFGTTFTFWWSSLRAEVYTMGTFFFLLSLWLSLRALESQSLKRISLVGLTMGLTLTCHLIFAPALALMAGLLLIKRSAGQWRIVPIAVTIAVTLVLGLSPYIYSMWADTQSFPMNYLHYTIELESNQFGLTTESFDDPWERIPWLILGREYLSSGLPSQPSILIRKVLKAGAAVFLFELGPLALLAFLVGCFYLVRKWSALSLLFLGMILATFTLAILVAGERMLPIFLLPATAGMAIVITYGIRAACDSYIAWRGSLPPAASLVGIILLLVMIGLPHLLRLHAYAHPIGPHGWQVEESCPPPVESLIPSLRGFTEARQYGEEVLSLVPEGALVVGKWNEIMPIYYLRNVEHLRSDIELDKFYAEHLIRLQRWQETHDTNRRPFVFLSPVPLVWDHVVELDSLAIEDGRILYVHRGNLDFD